MSASTATVSTTGGIGKLKANADHASLPRLRSRGKLAWSAFAFSLPIPPVVLTVAVLADIYL